MSFSQNNIIDSADELVVNLIASEDNQTASIDLDNSFFQTDLLNTKVILSFAQLDNTAVPLFIPKKLNKIPSYINIPMLLPTLSEIGVNSMSYIIAMNSTNDISTARWGILQWLPINQTLVTPSNIPNQKQVYSDNYYYSYTTTHFLKILENALILLFQAVHLATVPQIEVIFNGDVITIVIPNFVGANPHVTYIWINSDLRNLLRCNNYKISSADDMYILLPDIQKNYNGVDSSLYNSRFISRDWLAFDTILITTSLPLKSVEYQSNLKSSSSSSTEYKNVIFALNTLENSVNYYPYYEYFPTTTDRFKSFSQDTYNQPSFTINFYLYNKKNGLSIPYKLNKDEIITLDFIIQKI